MEELFILRTSILLVLIAYIWLESTATEAQYAQGQAEKVLHLFSSRYEGTWGKVLKSRQ